MRFFYQMFKLSLYILPFSIITAVPYLVQQSFSTNYMHFRKSCFDMKIFSNCISRQVQFQQIFGQIRLYLMSLIYGYVLRLYGGQPENGGGMRRVAKDLLRYGGITLFLYSTLVCTKAPSFCGKNYVICYFGERQVMLSFDKKKTKNFYDAKLIF